ncbi:MAG: hypothetical protein ABIN73_00005, partial [candidate division WOR-3 bacterium]
YNFGYILIRNWSGDTIRVGSNPYTVSNGIEFALNLLNAIKFSIMNNEVFFVLSERKNAFLNKINAAMNKINENEIDEAKEKIIDDVLPHAKEWVRGDGRYGVIRALEACVIGLTNPYEKFVYEPINTILSLSDNSYMIQINAPIKIIFPDRVEIITGNYVEKLEVTYPPTITLEGENKESLVNEFSKNAAVKESFRKLEEKGYVDTLGMRDPQVVALLPNEFYPPTIMGEYSGIAIVWVTQTDSPRVSDIVVVSDGYIVNAFASSGIIVSTDPIQIFVDYWEEVIPPQYHPQVIEKGEESLPLYNKAACLSEYLRCIALCYIFTCQPSMDYDYWICVRDCINPCYVYATIRAFSCLIRGGQQ